VRAVFCRFLFLTRRREGHEDFLGALLGFI
jgi:hypothetical protein